jgi:hypothetical protein
MKALVYRGPGQKAPQRAREAKLDQILEAYETFADAVDTQALKVIISA